MTQPSYYLQAPDGRCRYVVELDRRVHVEGWKDLPWSGKGYPHSVITDGPVAELTYTWKRGSVSGHALREPGYESARLPASLTVDEYEAMDELAQSHYQYTYDYQDVVETIDVSGHLPLPGEMPPDLIPSNWRPGPLVEFYGPTASHLVPGWLSGFRRHIVNTLKDTPGVSDVYEHISDKSLKVNIRSYWDPARRRTEGKGRNARTRETWSTSTIEFPCADLIGGGDLLDAQRIWVQRTAEILAQVTPYSTTRTCGHCDGRGFVANTPSKE